MQTKENIEKIFNYLNELYPNPQCELKYETPFQLLIAVILSAQCTDKRVNEVTPKLFAKYPTANELAVADLQDVEDIIRPLGFFRNKAKAIVNCSKQLVENFSEEQKNSIKNREYGWGVGISGKRGLQIKTKRTGELGSDSLHAGFLLKLLC